MPRGGNFRINAHKHLNDKIRFGYSKHAEKERLRAEYQQENGSLKGWNASRTDYIYSINTLKAYRQSVDSLDKYIKANGLQREIRSPGDLTKDVINKYLKEQQDQGKSMYTVSKDMAAINKITDYKLNITKKDAGLQARSYRDITQNRSERDHHRQYNPQNYQEGILMARAFGCRRSTIYGGKYQAKENSIYQDKDGNIYLRAIEKGGKYREMPALDKYKDELQQTFKIDHGESQTKDEFVKSYEQGSEYLVDKYTSKIESHAFRAEYAKELYQQLADQKGDDLQSDYKGYDQKLILEVSKALGHNREDVVVYNYLR